jgi:hypothetical protein
MDIIVSNHSYQSRKERKERGKIEFAKKKGKGTEQIKTAEDYF